jgi:hypothetical protein
MVWRQTGVRGLTAVDEDVVRMRLVAPRSRWKKKARLLSPQRLDAEAARVA